MYLTVMKSFTMKLSPYYITMLYLKIIKFYNLGRCCNNNVYFYSEISMFIVIIIV